MLAKHPTRPILFAVLLLLSFAASACIHEERDVVARAPAGGVTDATAISGFH